MVDRGDLWALAGGALIGGVVAGFWAARKARQLEQRGNVLAAALERDGAEVEAFLMTQGAELEEALQTLGQAEATRVARVAADQYMSDVYGITPERIAAVTQLAQTMGA